MSGFFVKDLKTASEFAQKLITIKWDTIIDTSKINNQAGMVELADTQD